MLKNLKLAGNTQTRLGLSTKNMWSFESHQMVVSTIIITHSIILMAITGPSYEFLYADIGTNGRVNDGGFSKALENPELSILNPRCLPGGVQRVPLVLIGDDVFALKTHMIKPYPQKNLTTERKVYNYRHSRGRRISENLFGILANRWHIYRMVMSLEPTIVESAILATLALRNMLMTTSAKNIYCPTRLCDTEDVNRKLILGIYRNDNCADSMFSLEKPKG